MTTKKIKNADVVLDFSPKPLTAKDKKHIAIYTRVLEYIDKNGGANQYVHLK